MNAGWLLLTESDDSCAAWLAEKLAAETGHSVLHVTSNDVDHAVRAERGADDDGVWFSMSLEDGRTVHSRRLLGVVNRLESPRSRKSHALPSLAPAVMDSSAPFVRWLQTWSGPVLNRPGSGDVIGDLTPRYRWVDLALVAGFWGPLQASGGDETSSGADAASRSLHRVVVIGDEVIRADGLDHAIPKSLTWRCLRMAQTASASVLGVDSQQAAAGGWRFVSASLRPDLQACGDSAIKAIVRVLGAAVHS